MAEVKNVTADNDRGADGIAVARRLLIAMTLLALVGTAVGWVLVQRIENTYRAALEITSSGADVAALGSASAVQLANDVSALTQAAAETLDKTRTFIELASASVDDVGTALGSNLAAGIEGTANIASGMAGFIETIERFIPGDSRSLAEDLRALSDGLEPVPDQLRVLGERLNTTADELLVANDSLDGVTEQLTALSTSIAEATVTLEQVDVLAADLAKQAQAALDRSGSDFLLVRLLVLVLGLGVAIASLAAYRALGAFARRTVEAS